ncbi:MAG TPA: hypothetical protein VEV41_04955 [Terriglobales bacterium]|nr:hypothetical protein [Terriglobales bacterium]
MAGDRFRAVREFFYGLFAFEFERQALEMRGELESAFMLITMGDMLGVPVIPPIYALRVLPYVVPNIATWKRRVLRERDVSDKEEFHLHGFLVQLIASTRRADALLRSLLLR